MTGAPPADNQGNERSIQRALRRLVSGPATGRAERALAFINRSLSRADVAVVRASTANSGTGMPPHLASARVDKSVTSNTNAWLHDLRTERLRQMPPGAEILLSAGCSGAWYFSWIDDAYPGVKRHIGIEAFLPRPADLPPSVEWIESTVGSMPAVSDESVDMVFSGQNIEHLWPEDVEGFLRESHRVLKPGGWLVLDSPNRTITEALHYEQPEHIAEFTPTEAGELLGAAGFSDIAIKGVALCFDADRQLLLPLPPHRVLDDWTASRRAAAAVDRPNDAFIWWAEARKHTGSAPAGDLGDVVGRIHDPAYAHRMEGFVSEAGRLSGHGSWRTSSVDRGQHGVLVRGPNGPVRAGRHVATFELRCGPGQDATTPIAQLQVSSVGGVVHAQRSVTAAEIDGDTLSRIELPFELEQTTMGVEFRVSSTGAAALTSRVHVGLA